MSVNQITACVHLQDRPLIGMYWQEQYYEDVLLQFGLLSAGLIFTAVADAIEWVVRQTGVEKIFHYIDDHIIGNAQCGERLLTLQQIAHNHGIIFTENKKEGLATLFIIGIEVDLVAMTLGLLAEKLERLVWA